MRASRVLLGWHPWLLYLTLLAMTGIAHGSPLERVTINGFGTLGVVYNNSDEMEFVRDVSQPRGADNELSTKPDSVFGLQLRYRFNDTLDATVQAVSRYTYTSSHRPRLAWAFVRYTPNPDLEVRLGRISWDVFMFSDNRNVGYGYLWVRPPIEYFGFRPLTFIDGLDLRYTVPIGNGLLWAKLYGGLADEEIPAAGGPNYELDGTRIVGGHINYEQGNWWFQLGAGEGKFRQESERLKPLQQALRAGNSPIAGDIGLKNASLRLLSAGVVYEDGPLHAQLLLNRGLGDTLTLPNFDAAYLLAGYRVDLWTPYISFAAIHSDNSRRSAGLMGPSGPAVDAAIDDLLRSVQPKQRSTAVGVRYDFLPNAALKFQVDRLHATNTRSDRLLRRPDPDWDGRAVIFSATLDFIF